MSEVAVPRRDRAVVAVVQTAATLGDVGANLERCLELLERAADDGAELVVFPECSLTGYLFDDPLEAAAAALTLDSSCFDAIAAACRRRGTTAIVGLVERAGEKLYNTAVVIDETGRLRGSYRKVHLPLLGVDRFVSGGDSTEAPLFETAIGRIGVNICYDIRFPEAVRILALRGAEIIAHPANWPVEASILAEHFARVRACENRVVVAVANRGDSEGGVDFVGLSQIVGADGQVLASAERGESIVVNEVNVAETRAKQIVRRPGTYETDFFGDRRPDLYGSLAKPPAA